MFHEFSAHFGLSSLRATKGKLVRVCVCRRVNIVIIVHRSGGKKVMERKIKIKLLYFFKRFSARPFSLSLSLPLSRSPSLPLSLVLLLLWPQWAFIITPAVRVRACVRVYESVCLFKSQYHERSGPTPELSLGDTDALLLREPQKKPPSPDRAKPEPAAALAAILQTFLRGDTTAIPARLLPATIGSLLPLE